LALAAYMRRDEATAGQFASRAVAARLPMGLVMRIVVCKRQGNQACVIEASQQLRRDFPGFAGDLGEAFFRHAFADEIRTALVSDAARRCANPRLTPLARASLGLMQSA
jgi:hypothetical protein